MDLNLEALRKANITADRRINFSTSKVRLNEEVFKVKAIEKNMSDFDYIQIYGFYLIGDDPDNIPVNLYTYDGHTLGRLWLTSANKDKDVFSIISEVDSLSVPPLSVQLYSDKGYVEEAMSNHQVPFYPKGLEDGYERIKKMFYKEARWNYLP